MLVPAWTIVSDTLLPDYNGIKLRFLSLKAEEPNLLTPTGVVGIDPGQVNMGLAVVYNQTALIYEATLPSSLDPIERIMTAAHAVQFLMQGVQRMIVRGCVEGAAHLAGPGQVPLGENRVSAAVTLMQAGVWPVTISPPASIREKVFGNGRLRAQEVWPNLPENAGSALGCALYAFYLTKMQ